MRLITDHIVPGDSASHQVKVIVSDEPGAGGACHAYAIAWPGPVAGGPDEACYVHFQEGPIKEHGVNGVTHEALLAIVIDRLKCFQAGPYACGANAIALSSCEEALRQLQKRTRERIARGVEGTHQA
jgi:hypothetical protein